MQKALRGSVRGQPDEEAARRRFRKGRNGDCLYLATGVSWLTRCSWRDDPLRCFSTFKRWISGYPTDIRSFVHTVQNKPCHACLWHAQGFRQAPPYQPSIARHALLWHRQQKWNTIRTASKFEIVLPKNLGLRFKVGTDLVAQRTEVREV